MRASALTALVFLAGAASLVAAPGPIEFDFVAPDNPAAVNPYARELWAEVTTPSGEHLTLPAYYADAGVFAVRVRPDEKGTYHLGPVSETTLGQHRSGLVVSRASPGDVDNAAVTRLPAIRISAKDPRAFVRSDGRPYVPVGANLAWAPDGVADRLGYYHQAMPAFARANLNWMRIWMCHWGGMNLDWLPKDMGRSPPPGSFSEDVARNWDDLLATAEANGVYVQLVLQHHGQYTTFNDSNWAENPWNAANPGGFLKSPEEFFTDRNARVITFLKYRYIVARWGWSPAILAWELFNEVHWTNAMRNGHESDVARWHSEMATYLRSVDVYHHLITTSTENLRSAIYEKMDYYQPHLYAANLLAGARSFDPAFASLDRPAFYGEEGDDHVPLPEAVKEAGLTAVPPVWASVMGQGAYAAQPWKGWDLLAAHRLDEVGAVFRFLAVNRVAEQSDLVPFSAAVDCAARVPHRIVAGQYWQRRAAPDIELPVDGREPVGEADIPSTLVGNDKDLAEGFPGAATYRLDLPRGSRMRAHVDATAPEGGGLRISVDGAVVAFQQWPKGGAVPKPDTLEFEVGAGRHTLALDNPGPSWVGISAIDTGFDEPVLGAIGRRGSRFIEVWVWNRANLYEAAPAAAASGTLALGDVPAGTWKVTWWDTAKGTAGASTTVVHPGGTLTVATPAITRHAAVALARVP